MNKLQNQKRGNVKVNRTPKTHEIAEELMDYELELLDRAIISRRSHLRSVDELDRRDLTPKQRKECRTKKRPFRDKKEADHILHLIMNNRREALETGKHYRFVQYRSYRCHCGYYHHSSKPELGAEAVVNVA